MAFSLGFARHPSLQSRLGLIALLSLTLGILPSGLLLRDTLSRLDSLQQEARGLPINRQWQAVLGQMQQQQQLATEALSTRPAAREEASQAAQKSQATLRTLAGALKTGGFPPAHLETLRALQASLSALDQGASANYSDVAKLLLRYQALERQAIDAIADFNGTVGLLLDPDPATHFAILAGLQTAPQVEAALSMLSSIAAAAAVDDLSLVSATLSRYHEHADAMLQQMRAAQAAGGPLAQALGPLLAQARQQRLQVDATLQAAAQDINYPLPQLAAGFKQAARQQTELSGQVLGLLEQQLQQRSQQEARQRNLLLILTPLLLACLSWVLLHAARQLLRPVRQMVAVTERIAAGDLSQAVPSGQGDELGRVLLAMAHMQQRLRDLVTQIHQGAGGIRLAAQEIAGGNQDLAARTEHAAAHLQQTASSVDLLDRAVQGSSRATADASSLARDASAMASQGGALVGRVIDTMGGIQDASRRIGDITGLIDGIAFQTNILALNAAVEAARAGEQGRGFAVVATEVRALSVRCTEAVKDIKLLIQQSSERVAMGSELAVDAGEAMQKILAQVAAVTQVMQGMDAHAREQAGQARELGQTVRAIDGMTQQNAALVQQSAASADALRGQAEAMESAALAFRL